MKNKWKTDLITGLVTILVFVVYYTQTFSIRQTTLVKLSSTFIPRLCAVAAIGLSLVIVLTALRDRKSASPTKEESPALDESGGAAKTIAAVVSFVLLFLSILLIEHAGFVWGSAFYLLSFFLLCSRHIKRNWLVYAVLTVAVPVLCYVAFAQGFHLRLPAGFLGLLGGIL